MFSLVTNISESTLIALSILFESICLFGLILDVDFVDICSELELLLAKDFSSSNTNVFGSNCNELRESDDWDFEDKVDSDLGKFLDGGDFEILSWMILYGDDGGDNLVCWVMDSLTVEVGGEIKDLADIEDFVDILDGEYGVFSGVSLLKFLIFVITSSKEPGDEGGEKVLFGKFVFLDGFEIFVLEESDERSL